MRYQGKIRQWQDAKGFGFVEPNGGGDKAFVHIRAFPAGSRRPADGDLITYRTEKDEQGRWRAVDARYSALRPSAPAPVADARSRTTTGVALGGLYVLGVTGLCAIGRWPWSVLALVVIASLVAFFAYWNDKRAAQRGGWRTPEAHLHLIALVGGWPGAALAQHGLRHKSTKRGFRLVFWATVAMNIVAAIWLLGPSGQSFLAALSLR